MKKINFVVIILLCILNFLNANAGTINIPYYMSGDSIYHKYKDNYENIQSLYNIDIVKFNHMKHEDECNCEDCHVKKCMVDNKPKYCNYCHKNLFVGKSIPLVFKQFCQNCHLEVCKKNKYPINGRYYLKIDNPYKIDDPKKCYKCHITLFPDIQVSVRIGMDKNDYEGTFVNLNKSNDVHIRSLISNPYIFLKITVNHGINELNFRQIDFDSKLETVILNMSFTQYRCIETEFTKLTKLTNKRLKYFKKETKECDVIYTTYHVEDDTIHKEFKTSYYYRFISPVKLFDIIKMGKYPEYNTLFYISINDRTDVNDEFNSNMLLIENEFNKYVPKYLNATKSLKFVIYTKTDDIVFDNSDEVIFSDDDDSLTTLIVSHSMFVNSYTIGDHHQVIIGGKKRRKYGKLVISTPTYN